MADETPDSPERVPRGGIALMIATVAVLFVTSVVLNWQRWREKDLETAVVTMIATPTPEPAGTATEETLPAVVPAPTETPTPEPTTTVSPTP